MDNQDEDIITYYCNDIDDLLNWIKYCIKQYKLNQTTIKHIFKIDIRLIGDLNKFKNKLSDLLDIRKELFVDSNISKFIEKEDDEIPFNLKLKFKLIGSTLEILSVVYY
jgi:hypothetical protein